MAQCLGTYGDPRGLGVSYERGNPVAVMAGVQPRVLPQDHFPQGLLRPAGMPSTRGLPRVHKQGERAACLQRVYSESSCSGMRERALWSVWGQ